MANMNPQEAMAYVKAARIAHGINLDSTEGREIEKCVLTRLAVLRGKLESDLSERETQKTRGAIEELVALIQPAAPQLNIHSYSNPAGREHGRY